MRPLYRYAWLAATLALAACSEVPNSPQTAQSPGTGVSAPKAMLSVTAPIQCTSPDSSQALVDKLVPQLFGPGQGRRGTAQVLSNRMDQARRNGDRAAELLYADSLVNYALQNYYAGNLIGGQSTTTQQNLLNFIYA